MILIFQLKKHSSEGEGPHSFDTHTSTHTHLLGIYLSVELPSHRMCVCSVSVYIAKEFSKVIVTDTWYFSVLNFIHFGIIMVNHCGLNLYLPEE